MIGNNYSNTGHHNQHLQQRRNAMLNRISSELEHTFRDRIDISIHPQVSFTEKNQLHTLDFVIFHPNGVILIDCAPDYADTFRSIGSRQICIKPSDNPNIKHQFEMTPLMKIRRKDWIIKHAKLPDHANNPILRLLIQRADETWHQIVVAERVSPLMAEDMLDSIQLLVTPNGLAGAITQLILNDDQSLIDNPLVNMTSYDKTQFLKKIKQLKQRSKAKPQTPQPHQKSKTSHHRPDIFSNADDTSNKTKDAEKPRHSSPIHELIELLNNTNSATAMRAADNKTAKIKTKQPDVKNDTLISCKICTQENQFSIGYGVFGYYSICNHCGAKELLRSPYPRFGNTR